MFLKSIEIVKMKEPFEGPLALTEIEVSKSYHAKPIIELQYFPSFIINGLRWACLLAILMNEDVTFIMGQNTCRGNVIQCEVDGLRERISLALFNTYEDYLEQSNYTTMTIYLEIQIVEVCFNE